MKKEPKATVGREAEEPADDPVATAILDMLDERGSGRAVTAPEVARAIAKARARPGDPPDQWRRTLPAVKQQALNLARKGRIVMLRKGKPLDPFQPVKGLIRLALPAEPDQ